MTKAYDKIAEQLLAMTDEAGAWTPCWHRRGLTTPRNAITGRKYSGMNVLSLWCGGTEFCTPLWATYRQWNEAGAQVSRGSKGTPIVFWSAQKDEASGERKFFSRSFTVFNRDQVVNPPPLAEVPANPDERLPHVDVFISYISETAKIQEQPGIEQPCYIPSLDVVQMPPFDDFHHAEGYYSTMLHELTHWTGHKDRENRAMSMQKDLYAAEELVAELGACFLAADLGIEPEPRPDHAQYIKHWHAMLSKDPAVFATAVSLARKAAERLTNLGREKELEPAS